MSNPGWLSELLADPRATDICLNGSREAFVDRGNGMVPVGCGWSEPELKNWMLAVLSRAGKSWDSRNPFVDATLETGHRLQATFPPISSKGLLVSLRRLTRASGGATERWASSPLYGKLCEISRSGESLILSGSTGSGKTTLLTDLIDAIPETERILALEDTAELFPTHPHFVALTARPPNADGCGEISLRTLLRQTLRMRPDRIVLGECRGSEVLELLQALNTGHRGTLATLHSNSPRDALKRIELLCLLGAGGTIPLSAIRELIATGIRWVAQVSRTDHGRRITELHRIEGREGDTILTRPMLH